MINVNWSKIKPFEKKSFALSVTIILGIIMLALIIASFVINGGYAILKILSALMLTAVAGLLLHIESRMLQIYMLGGVIDVILALSLIKSKGIALIIISALLLISLIVLMIVEKIKLNEGTMYNSPEPSRASVFADKKVMLFAPHEDDEINLYGGIIEQYVKNGSKVKVVFSTNGDVYGIGKTRIKEALKVAKSYGLNENDFIFLGYSDSIKNDEGKHIYNCADDEKLVSVKGYENAYGTESHNSYSNKSFTRKNIVDDFRGIILDYKPDVIYCCDYDTHPDHRAIGLFFEEALGEILKANSFYAPKVYKGFAYSLAWMGKLDYYSLNSLSTHQWIVGEMMPETNVFRWDERLRLPVSRANLSHIIQNASSYKAMMKYSSQTATDHANGILNNDKVFWERRTDSLLYNANILATSGDASHICDFKLVDSDDITKTDLMPTKNAWTASLDDDNRIIILSLKDKKSISELVIYTSQDPNNIILDATVKIGGYQFSTGKLKMGANHFTFNSVSADKLAIRIDEYQGKCSLLKLEAFEKVESKNAQIIKLVNMNDDFCYDYIIDSIGIEKFKLYTYPKNASDSFEFDVTGGIEYDFEDDSIIIKCAENEEGVLTIRSRENPLIYDQVRFSNPNEEVRSTIVKKQKLEQILWTLPMQYDYYSGLIRRLGVYSKPQ